MKDLLSSCEADLSVILVEAKWGCSDYTYRTHMFFLTLFHDFCLTRTLYSTYGMLQFC